MPTNNNTITALIDFVKSGGWVDSNDRNPDTILNRHPIIVEGCFELGWYDPRDNYWVDEDNNSIGQLQWLDSSEFTKDQILSILSCLVIDKSDEEAARKAEELHYKNYQQLPYAMERAAFRQGYALALTHARLQMQAESSVTANITVQSDIPKATSNALTEMVELAMIDQFIEKYLHFDKNIAESQLKPSAELYAKHGKMSGSLYLSVQKVAKDYHDSHSSQMQAEINALEEKVAKLQASNDAMAERIAGQAFFKYTKQADLLNTMVLALEQGKDLANAISSSGDYKYFQALIDRYNQLQQS